VGGHTREAAAWHMLLTTLAMVCGFLATALCIGTLRRWGVPPGRVMTLGNALGLLAMAAIWRDAGSSQVLWFVLGVVFAVGNIAYAELTGLFGPALAGRVNAALNLAAFVGAFAVQWGYGVLLDGLQAAGWTVAEAHRAAFAALLVLQVAGFAWFLVSRQPAGRCGAR